MRANATKCSQTSTNASNRRDENVSKRKQMRADADNRKETLTPPFLAASYEKSAQRRSFGPDIHADIRQKTSVRPSKSWKKKQASWHGHPARTSMKKAVRKKKSG